MSILVIDHISKRKSIIEAALTHVGMLLTERRSQTLTMLEKLSQSHIVIVMSNNTDIEWTNPAWHPALSKLIYIGPKNVLDNIQMNEQSYRVNYSDDDTLIHELTKLVIHVAYQHFFPITHDLQMHQLLNIAKKVAKSSASVLIEGETGTGKELIAQYIHQHSPRFNQPFVAINCAAIPETMIEAILFGYEKGAFTNAVNSYVGKFEQANNGTLFLDEIAEMSTELQAKLLRVLQENEVERIGGRVIHKINVRIIAATNQPLKQQINHQFRTDLYYRLNVVNLKCIPLRMRTNDIIPLANYFLQLYSQMLDVSTCTLHTSAVSLLQEHNWPGNVRELQNVIHRAVILAERNIIEASDLESMIVDAAFSIEDEVKCSLRAKEAETIVNTLKETNGCRSDAAKRLMISPRTLRYKISKLKSIGLDVP